MTKALLLWLPSQQEHQQQQQEQEQSNHNRFPQNQPRAPSKTNMTMHKAAYTVITSILALMQIVQFSSTIFEFQSQARDKLQGDQSPILPTLREVLPVHKRIALCHKTIFGDIDFQRFVDWSQYHHDLGFDDIFIWYLPEMKERPGFSELEQLPYVKMIPNNIGQTRLYEANNYLRVDMDKPGNQLDFEGWCLNDVAANHSWALLSDVDEFLWFKDRMGVHEFADKHGTQQGNTWLSFGKWMYSLKHVVASQKGADSGRGKLANNLYGLSRNSFTARSHCTSKEDVTKRGSSYCPKVLGRSKVMVKPSEHKRIRIHGFRNPKPEKGIVHFDTSIAHMKEWPKLFREFKPVIMPPEDTVTRTGKTNIHTMEISYQKTADGDIPLYYDPDLQPWMEYVKSRQR